MKRLIKYFQQAKTTKSSKRTLGLEIETLFISKGQPISMKISQAIMSELIQKFLWNENTKTNRIITNIEKDGFNIIYDLGWNLFELTSPPYLLSQHKKLIQKCEEKLQELYRCASKYGAEPIFGPFDGFHNKTLIIPDKRDEIWLKLDGPVLKELGHIASVHYNLSLSSIAEGMRLIKNINTLYRKLNIPPESVRQAWEKYIKNSWAKYEIDRYAVPPETFDQYCYKLSRFKVVMNIKKNKLIREKGEAFYTLDEVDIDLFLRSVWWWTRLRKRNGKLILEIRGFPRQSDKNIQDDLKLIKSFL